MLYLFAVSSTCAKDNPCRTQPCSNSGVCAEQSTQPFYTCSCLKGYFGYHCEHNVCDIHPCKTGVCRTLSVMPYFSCSCPNGFSGDLCQDSMSSTLSPTTTLTPGFSTCDKYSTLTDIVERTQGWNNVTTCISGSNTSPEAFVINNCNVTSSYSLWQNGIKVMDACRGAATLPTYTPVGIFGNGKYIDALQGGTSGIFLGCLGDSGFKIGAQSCDSVPLIKHINGTFFTMDPGMYFAIM